jgi:drug/metabolite transporter (DMT)-like permease
MGFGPRRALALAVLWLVWGSTYLAVAQLLPSLPPFVLSALRFLVAAPLLAAGAWLSGEPLPSASQLRAAALVGVFLFLGGNGGTVYAQTRIPSGLTAVMVGMVPLWLVILAAVFQRDRPGARQIAGVTLGLLGVVGLAGGSTSGRIDPVGVVSVIAATLSWATGSLLARKLAMPRSVAWSTAAQMGAGSVGLGLASLLTGQLQDAHPQSVDALGWACFVWLVLGGSIAALVAYNWLLRVSTPAVATSYAYVNPVVALWLGWWLGGEQLSAWELGCSVSIVLAVVLVLKR